MFEKFHSEQISYSVIHGYDNLPYDYSGHDIDILINYVDIHQIKSIINSLIVRNSLKIFRIEERQQLLDFVIYSDKLEVIVLQFIFKLDYRGIPFFSNLEVFKNIRKHNDISILSFFHETVYSFFASLFWGRTVKEKYHAKFLDLVNQSEFIDYFESKIGSKYYSSFADAVNEKDFQRIIALRNNLIYAFFKKSFRKDKRNLLIGFVRRYYLGIYNALKNKGKFVVLVGPDGVGKTSLSHVISNYLKDIFRDIKYFHFIPNKIISLDVKEILSADKLKFTNRKQSSFFSYVRILRNMMRFIFYYHRIIFFLYKQNLVIGDRYFFNYFLDPSSVKYFGAEWFVRLIYRIIPKPDYIFFVIADPETVQSRKQELSNNQIVCQINYLMQLQKTIKNSILIRNDFDIHETALKMSKIILQKK